MVKCILLIVGTILLVCSIVFNFIFYDLWNQEKTANFKANVQYRQVESKLKASESNTPRQLTSIGKDFGVTLFTFNKDYRAERKKHLLSLISPSLYKWIFDSTGQGGSTDKEPIASENPKLSSVGKVVDTVYNWTGTDTAKVILTIEQILSVGFDSEKSVSQLTVNLKNNGSKWIITGFNAQQIM